MLAEAGVDLTDLPDRATMREWPNFDPAKLDEIDP